MKLCLRVWMIWLGALGLLLPVAFLLRWQIAGVGFGALEFVLWPASIMLMGLEGNHSVVVILMSYAIVLAANVVMYAFVALLTWPLLRLFPEPHAERATAVAILACNHNYVTAP